MTTTQIKTTAGDEGLILVIGATGAQGGAAARLLLQQGRRVRVLVRDPRKARDCEELGAEVRTGDLSEPGSLEAALEKVYGVFAIPVPVHDGPGSEYRYAVHLIEAARRAGVRHFIQTSVAAAGGHRQMPNAGTGYWNDAYWESKWLIEEAVRQAGFPLYTILKPTMFMENFTPPMVSFLSPDLVQGRLVTALRPDTRVQFIAVRDIGAFAAAAFTEPQRFGGRTIELASEAPTMEEAAAALTAATGRTVTAVFLSYDEARAQGRALVREDEWLNDIGHRAPIGELAAYGVRLTPFREWAEENRNAILIG
ncbi:NmrA family NAD(P)-binding protein [Paenibacillus mucilaginosus]|uniref:NmrA family protein n=2 Tax=Paenibacillus mucilaginosus TaxID=61624 RepID=F8F9K0_PAEMK|nr:NmrA family NAD(P)-binding protein [Paenibacillus mucilaginosus]AEI43689.1 NmrA family protein [Paenibacillus mucilaginosus KNP414]MCG7216927.1 NmrA family NAD(P)-binding protein [Paenibacillus mucilaginosus]WDM25211.1 NmrA family NAD(P)-binding protein [Paenibacillus mucilaginosus]